MSHFVKRIFLHVLLPLFIGFFIYFFFRPDILFIQWFTNREPAIPLHQLNKLQELFIFSGPDFCWSYSLSSALFIWEKWQGKKIRLFPLVVLMVVVCSELIQYLLASVFTPDWIDVLAALSAFILSYLLIRRQVNEK
jgi:predicted Na+-dependent transporter